MALVRSPTSPGFAAAARRLLLERRWPPGLLTATFASYVALLAWGISRHEPWFDEAQAWLLARDLSFWDLQARHLRYEGSPGLWHALLFAASRMGIGYIGMSVIGGAAAAAGVFLLLRYSPFPIIVRSLLPFTFFLGYQYAVVARSYDLMAPALFAAAILYPARIRRPIAFSVVLALLSNTCLHGFLIASGIAAAVVVPRLAQGTARIRSRTAVAASIFLVSAAWIVWQVRPPRDLAFAPEFHFGWSRFAVAAGTLSHNALTESPLLSEGALAVSVWWMWRRRTLLVFLLPALLLVALAGFRYSNVWHEGAFWLLWIFALWITFGRPEAEDDPDARAWLPAVAVAVLVVSAVQIVWTTRTYAYDLALPYSGSRELARALQTSAMRRGRIQIDGFRPVAALPYLGRNVFSNLNGGQPEAYWPWSTSNRLVREGRTAVWEGNPEWAILSSERAKGEIPLQYVLVARFPGALFWKTRILEADAYAVYAYRPAARGADAKATTGPAR